MTRNLVLASVVLGFLSAAFAQSDKSLVTLTVNEPAGIARGEEPVTSGVPFARGVVPKGAAFSLADAGGKAVPLQTRVLQQWPDGSVKWVLVDFQAGAEAGKSADFKLLAQAGAQPAQAIKVADAADGITVDTGALLVTLSKKQFDLFSDVKIDGKTALNGKPGGIVITDTAGKTRTSLKELAEGYKLEVVEPGSLRTVVRATGEMTANDQHKIGFTCWYHFYAGSKNVRVFFTIRVLDGRSITAVEQRPIKDLGYMKYSLEAKDKQGQSLNNYALEGVDLVLGVAPAKQFALGGDPAPVSGDLADSVKLYQDSSAGWMWQAADGKIADPRLKANKEYMDKKNPQAGKPFFEYEKNNFDLMTNKEHGVGYSFRGYKATDGAAKETAAGDRAPGWAQLGSTTVGVRWFWQQCPKAIELKSDGTIRLGLWPSEFSSPFLFEGRIHRTHEILFAFGDKPGAESAQATFTRFDRRLLAVAPKEHYCASGAFNGPLMPENRKDFARFEDWALTAVKCGVNPALNPSFDSSFEIEREKLELYGVWHFGDSNKEAWRGFGQYLELDIPYCLAAHFARTTNRAFFDEAEIHVRHLMDVAAHGGGYGHQAGESSHYYTTGSMFYYFLTGLEFIKESLKVSHDEFARPAPWHLRSFTMTMWSNLDMYRLFGEQQYLDKIKADWAWFVGDPKKPAQDPATGFRAYGQVNFQEFMLGMGMDAMGRYCLEFPDDQEYRDRLVAYGNAVMRTHDRGERGISETGKDAPWRQDNSNCNGHTWAYIFTGRDKHLDFAAKLLDESVRCLEGFKGEGLDPEWPRFRTGTASGKYWSEFGHRNTQTCMWARWNRQANGTPKAPAAIADLAGTLVGDKLTLVWTAPAAEGGNVERYFVKIASMPIKDDIETKEAGKTAANWWMLPPVKDAPPAPGKPNDKQTMTLTVTGAGPVYAAVRSARQVGWITAVSELSNVVEAKK